MFVLTSLFNHQIRFAKTGRAYQTEWFPATDQNELTISEWKEQHPFKYEQGNISPPRRQ